MFRCVVGGHANGLGFVSLVKISIILLESDLFIVFCILGLRFSNPIFIVYSRYLLIEQGSFWVEKMYEIRQFI